MSAPNPKKPTKYKEWVPKKQQQSYHVTGWYIKPDGSHEVALILIDSETGMDKTRDETIIFPDYARDSLILNEPRNMDLADFCAACNTLGRNVLVLCERVAHIYYLVGELPRHGFTGNVGIVHGANKLDERKKAKEDFANGKTSVLIASSIFDEGEDLQNVGAVGLAGGGSSLIRQVQRIGRGVRSKSQVSNWCPIWFPVDTNNSFVKDHTIARLEYLDRAGVHSELVTADWLTVLKEMESKHGQT